LNRNLHVEDLPNQRCLHPYFVQYSGNLSATLRCWTWYATCVPFQTTFVHKYRYKSDACWEHCSCSERQQIQIQQSCSLETLIVQRGRELPIVTNICRPLGLTCFFCAIEQPPPRPPYFSISPSFFPSCALTESSWRHKDMYHLCPQLCMYLPDSVPVHRNSSFSAPCLQVSFFNLKSFMKTVMVCASLGHVACVNSMVVYYALELGCGLHNTFLGQSPYQVMLAGTSFDRMCCLIRHTACVLKING